MEKYKLLNLAEDALKNEKEPLTALQIWEIAKEKGYIEKGGFKGKDAFYTMARKISLDIKNNPASVFIKLASKPNKFILSSEVK